ncbi:hypothetical protein AALB64_09410 [Lachnospiraceae bacterium 45-P1]
MSMNDNETQNLILEELKTLKSDMEVLKIKSELTHRKLDGLTLDVKIAERIIRKDISHLKDAQKTIFEVLEQKGILPKAN